MAQPEVVESAGEHQRVQTILRIGLAVAVVAMLAGLGVSLTTGRWDMRAVRISEIAGPMDPGTRLVTLGIVALALTPAVRVLALVVLWARARDWRFAAVALVVVGILTTSVLVGAG